MSEPEAQDMHVRFSDDYDHTFPGSIGGIAFKADYAGPVKREVGDAAIAAGKAEEIPTPPRDPLDHDNNGRKGGAVRAKTED